MNADTLALVRTSAMPAADGGRAQPAAEADAHAARPLRRVFIRELEVVASVGVYEHEKRYLQRIIVSLTLDVVDRYDACSDDVADVYDYDHAIAAVHATLGEEHVHLIETAAERIATRCLDHADVR
ncbi:MAG: dihydroneopterin aldolase, partial [Pseudomonadota bacterium]